MVGKILGVGTVHTHVLVIFYCSDQIFDRTAKRRRDFFFFPFFFFSVTWTQTTQSILVGRAQYSIWIWGGGGAEDREVCGSAGFTYLFFVCLFILILPGFLNTHIQDGYFPPQLISENMFTNSCITMHSQSLK